MCKKKDYLWVSIVIKLEYRRLFTDDEVKKCGNILRGKDEWA